ncbi:MAG TPA: hypothetical protein VHX65_08245 [Pirellulales bacterium]|jgi:hypothetical protein|nr:hypothetical protein [Pirellulales bacterium]
MRRLVFLTAASAILAMAAGLSSAHAAEGEGHGGHGPVRNGGEGVHAGPTKSAEHMETHKGPWVPPKEIPHEGGVSIFGGKEHNPGDWRYRYEHGEWWYWTPNNHWNYYDNGAWQDYAADGAAVTVPVPSDPNYYWYKNQWWYLRGDHWSYYDHDHWHEGAPGMGPPRREGVIHGEIKNEHPPRVDEHEGKKK